jgi:hypothetical protein
MPSHHRPTTNKQPNRERATLHSYYDNVMMEPCWATMRLELSDTKATANPRRAATLFKWIEHWDT